MILIHIMCTYMAIGYAHLRISLAFLVFICMLPDFGNLDATVCAFILKVFRTASYRTPSDLTFSLPAAIQTTKPGPNPFWTEHQWRHEHPQQEGDRPRGIH